MKASRSAVRLEAKVAFTAPAALHAGASATLTSDIVAVAEGTLRKPPQIAVIAVDPVAWYAKLAEFNTPMAGFFKV